MALRIRYSHGVNRSTSSSVRTLLLSGTSVVLPKHMMGKSEVLRCALILERSSPESNGFVI